MKVEGMEVWDDSEQKQLFGERVSVIDTLDEKSMYFVVYVQSEDFKTVSHLGFHNYIYEFIH